LYVLCAVCCVLCAVCVCGSIVRRLVVQADAIEHILCKKLMRFMMMRAENFFILRRKPVEGYDISFLITNFHTEAMYKHKLVDFVIQVGPSHMHTHTHTHTHTSTRGSTSTLHLQQDGARYCRLVVIVCLPLPRSLILRAF
jgi:hypothetical protein